MDGWENGRGLVLFFLVGGGGGGEGNGEAIFWCCWME